MMILFDLTFTVELIAIGLGIVMLIWGYRNEGTGVAVAKLFGYIITIAAACALLCTSYYGLAYWNKGFFSSPMVMENIKQMHQQQNQ